jgi:chromosomal replication initiation ATPase DnaA
MPPEFPGLTASTPSENPWEKLKGYMRPQLPRSTYDTWLKDTTLLTATQDEYAIRVRDANTRDWLTQRLKGKIALSLHSITGRQITVKYVTAEPFGAEPFSTQEATP